MQASSERACRSRIEARIDKACASLNPLNNALQRFLKEAFACEVTELPSSYAVKYGMAIKPGGIYVFTEKYQAALKEIVFATLKKYGETQLDEDHVEDCLWKVVQQAQDEELVLAKSASTTWKIFSDLIGDTLAAPAQYLCPNYIIMLDEDIKEFRVGTVNIRRTTDVANGLIEKGTPFHIHVGEKFGTAVTYAPDMKHHMTFPPVCFLVSVSAAPGRQKLEALWAVDVAVSLVRLFYDLNKVSTAYYPQTGHVENPATIEKAFVSNALVFQPSGTINTLTSGYPRLYALDAFALKSWEKDGYLALSDKIFNSFAGTVARRVYQGLGWMTKARVSDDPADRLLFFFTALECLLSQNNSAAPITDTISRHAATIISGEHIHVRAELATMIKALYVRRSKVVHTGSREVTTYDARTLQTVCENAYKKVILKAALEDTNEKFQADLAAASYGAAWPI